MKAKRAKRSVKGVIIVNGKTLDMRIPKNVIDIFKGEPRLIFKKLEWYGIHPIPIQMLSKQLQAMNKDYLIMAVPREIMK
jgi:hypothetical protein